MLGVFGKRDRKMKQSRVNTQNSRENDNKKKEKKKQNKTYISLFRNRMINRRFASQSHTLQFLFAFKNLRIVRMCCIEAVETDTNKRRIRKMKRQQKNTTNPESTL